MKKIAGLIFLVVTSPFIVLGALTAIPLRGFAMGFMNAYEDIFKWLNEK